MSFQDPPVITPSGWIEHGPFAAWLVEATSPDLLVELGTHWGYSFFAFCEAVRTLGLDTRCVAIDTWEGDEHAGFYSDEVHDYVASVAKGYGSTATMMRMRFDQAVGSFEDGSIDVLHIDGRHLYEDAVEDFDTYLPKMSDRGVVVMHDIVERGHGFGVWRHWVELKDRYPTFEFRHEHGLGVVAVGHDAPEAIGRLTSLGEDSAEADQVRRMYSQLGRAISGAEGMRRAEELQTALAAANERLQHTTDAIARQAAGRELTLLRTVRDLERDVREARHLTPNLFKGLLRERLRAEGVRLLDSQGPEQTMRDQLAALFDADYYAAQHPELAPEEATFEHYVENGWPAHESPTPLIDPVWYLAVNPDVAAAGIPAVDHYLIFGESEARDPNAVSDSSWYRRQHAQDLAPGELALTRFATVGHQEGHDPSPAFHTKWYLDRYPEVADSGRIALSDYLRDGALKGRDPHPDFDTVWYIAANADLCRDGTNPLVHYLTFGLEENHATNAAGAHLCDPTTEAN